jgi:F0F1-type ATP synthase membrane subunit c/vacuolar-type H+-ATPase subunit K
VCLVATVVRVSPSAKPGQSPALSTLRLLVAVVAGALVLMGVAVSVILGFGAPALWAVVLLLLLGVLAYLALDKTGYRVPPVSPHLSAEAAKTRAVGLLRTSLMRRLALAESVAIIGLVLSFVAGQTALLFWLGTALTVLLLALHVWPSLRTVDRLVLNLEKEGARTGLRQFLGLGGTSDGPVTRRG